jgi:hypothetical protein
MTTASKIREAQLRAARGLGGPAELADYERADEGTGDRAAIANALANLLPDVSAPATVEEPNYDPRDPRHQATRSQWVSFADAERNFAADNPDYVQRVRNTKLPAPITKFIISEKLPQLAYYLTHRESAGLVRWLSALDHAEQTAELERLAHELMHSKKIPAEQRGTVRLGDMETDAYLNYRASGNRDAESPRQSHLSRESLGVDEYVKLRRQERRDYRKVRGHR